MYIVGPGEPSLLRLSQACTLRCRPCKIMSQQEAACHIWGLVTHSSGCVTPGHATSHALPEYSLALIIANSQEVNFLMPPAPSCLCGCWFFVDTVMSPWK